MNKGDLAMRKETLALRVMERNFGIFSYPVNSDMLYFSLSHPPLIIKFGYRIGLNSGLH